MSDASGIAQFFESLQRGLLCSSLGAGIGILAGTSLARLA
jgi:hypothetical protein